MRKFFGYKILAVCLMCMAMLFFYNCKSTPSNLYEIASASDMIVAQINPITIYENAGCDVTNGKVELSKALKQLSRDTKADLEVLRAKGVSLENAVISVRNLSTWVMAFNITSQPEFKKYLLSIDSKITESEEEGYTIFRFTPSCAIYIQDNNGYLLYTGKKPSSTPELLQYKKQSADNPLMPWQRQSLTQGNALNVVARTHKIMDLWDKLIPTEELSKIYDQDQLIHGYFTINASLNQLEASAQAVFTDTVGNTLDSKIVKTVDTSLLKYVDSKDLAVAMFAVPGDFDWKTSIDNLSSIPSFSYLLNEKNKQIAIDAMNAIDGTIMITAGPKSVMGIHSPADWDATIAIEFKEGKAQEYIEKLRHAIEESSRDMCRMEGDTLKVEMYMTPYEKASAAIVNDGGTFVATFNKPVSAPSAFGIPAKSLDGMCGVLAIDVPQDNIFSTLFTFPFGLRIVYGTDGTTISFSAQETDCEGLFLENIINFACAH